MSLENKGDVDVSRVIRKIRADVEKPLKETIARLEAKVKEYAVWEERRKDIEAFMQLDKLIDEYEDLKYCVEKEISLWSLKRDGSAAVKFKVDLDSDGDIRLNLFDPEKGWLALGVFTEEAIKQFNESFNCSCMLKKVRRKVYEHLIRIEKLRKIVEAEKKEKSVSKIEEGIESKSA